MIGKFKNVYFFMKRKNKERKKVKWLVIRVVFKEENLISLVLINEY